MNGSREQQIVSAFVDLAGSLASGFDPIDLCTTLTERCVAILDVSTAGLVLADGLGELHVLAASSQGTRDLQIFQLQRDEGPCRDCYHFGAPVSAPDLSVLAERWPRFVPQALAEGLVSVQAVPLRLREGVLGSLGLFRSEVGDLDAADHELAQALADVAAVALVQEHAAADRTLLVEQLQTALNSRTLIEQAKGALAYAGDLTVGDAFQAMRHFSRDHNLRLSGVAAAVVDRSLGTQEVLDHARLRQRG